MCDINDKPKRKVPRVFISYSRGTNDEYIFVKQLIARIAAQPLEPWDFEILDDQIKTGVRIDQACMDEIDRADVFIALITDAALKSYYVKLEVAHVLDRAKKEGKNIYIFPISLTGISDWGEPFNHLRALKNTLISIKNFNTKPRSEIAEEIILDLCRALNVSYIAPDQDAPNLPLRRNLMIELDGLANLNEQSAKIIKFGEILDVCSRLIAHLTNGNYKNSLSSIIYLEEILASNEYFPGHIFYYVSIVKAVIYFNLGVDDVKNIKEAKRIFQELIDQNHPLLDVNAYAGVGNIAMRMGDFNCALENHRKAYEICPQSDACFHNFLLSKLALRKDIKPIEIYEKADSVELGLATQSPGSINRMAILLIFGLVQLGDFERAIKLRRLLKNIDQDQGDLIVSIINSLFAQAEAAEDIELMEIAEKFGESFLCESKRFTNKNIMSKIFNAVAWIKNYLGDGQTANEYFQFAINNSPRNIRYINDMAIQLLEHKRFSMAEKLLLDVVSLDPVLVTEEMDLKEYHYYLGSVYWLLSKDEAAEANYLISGEYGKNIGHYSKINDWVMRIPNKNH